MDSLSPNKSKAPAKPVKSTEQDARAAAGGESDSSWVRSWVVPSLLVGGLAILSYILLRVLDLQTGSLIEQGLKDSISNVFFLTHSEDVSAAIGGVAEVLIAILGLVITVVAIVLQLAAQRYTPKLVELFIADRVNISYFILMVVASVYSLLLIYSTTSGFLPFWGALMLLGMTTLILSLLPSYFIYVFHFLTPENIIRILRRNANLAMKKVVEKKPKKAELRRLQNEVANSMAQISDIALSAVSQMDRSVSLMSIRSLKDVMVDHLLLKRKMPGRWFIPAKDHFPAISSDFIQELYVGRNWVEMKGFLDMELIFKMAIKEMPDAVSAIANGTKIAGLYAIKLKDRQVLMDVIQIFNTFLRHAVNARNPKAIYNLFYQYRQLAEAVLTFDEELVERIAFYFKYYGQIAQSYNVPMILITASFDLAGILKRAYELKTPNLHALINTFLEIDDNPATQANEFDLRSVRKAQLLFASFLQSQGDTELLNMIVEDLKVEPRQRMDSIRKEMMAVKDRKFWEVTDRGVDFFYMDDEQKEYLNQFYNTHIEPHYAASEPALKVQQG